MAEKRISKGAAVGLGLGVLVIAGIAIAARKKPGPPSPPPPGLVNLFGYVTNKNTGAPVTNAHGTVYQDYDTETDVYDFTTDNQGFYVIKNMLYDVDVTQMVIYADGYVTYANENVHIGEGNNELNIQMVPV